jgi:hypothetical protein
MGSRVDGGRGRVARKKGERLPTTTNPYYEIRSIATRHKVGTAILAGLVATHLASMLGFWEHGWGLTVLDFNTLNGLQLLPHASHNVDFFAGTAAHYTNGVSFAVLYAFTVHALLPIRNTALGNMVKALIFGTGLALFALLVMVPLVFVPQAHLGFFSHRAGFTFILSTFVVHWAYGFILGSIYNPLPDKTVIESQVSLNSAAVNRNGSESTGARTTGIPMTVEG